MRRTYPLFARIARPVVNVSNGTFYRNHPSAVLAPSAHGNIPNQPLFPGLDFSLPSENWQNQYWAILSPSSTVRSTFLQILRGQYVCIPPTARTYPHLSSGEIANKDPRLRNPANALHYVGFDAERGGLGGSSMRGAYLSARYESRREETDFSLLDYLKGDTELNAATALRARPPSDRVDQVIADLKLDKLLSMPVSNLSNGQTRRARIAKALLGSPEVLLLDGPFMGLDPPTLQHLSSLLHNLAKAAAPRIVLSLRPDDDIPHWITCLLYAGSTPVASCQGQKDDVLKYIRTQFKDASMKTGLGSMDNLDQYLRDVIEVGRHLEEKGTFHKTLGAHEHDSSDEAERVTRDGFSTFDTSEPESGDPLVEMQGVIVRYCDRAVLGDWQQYVDGRKREGLWWEVRQGQRWGIFGPNGSGKTTLLSLITSDHPQTYSLPIRLFSRSRLPQPGVPGISLFELQSKMGHASPEVHAFFPRKLSLRRSLESAWADAPLSKPVLTHDANCRVDACLRWFRAELDPKHGTTEALDMRMTRRKERLTKDEEKATLQRLKDELSDPHAFDWAEQVTFAELSFSAQRVVLFLRATIRNPPLVILDEAFSGMDDHARDKCIAFLTLGETKTLSYEQTYVENVGRLRDQDARLNAAEHHEQESQPQSGRPGGRPPNHPRPQLERQPSPLYPHIADSLIKHLDKVQLHGLQKHQALLVVSHNPDEIPGCVRDWICLPESGAGVPRVGRLAGPVEGSPQRRWKEIWGMDWESR